MRKDMKVGFNSQSVKIGNHYLYFGKCEAILPTLEADLVDSVIMDPPYLYLNHKLDIPFDEELVFSQLNRILKDDRLIAFFGRGDSFYRWNLMFNKLGFQFKEHGVWDKNASSNFLCNFLRVHEDIAFRSKGKKSINKCYIDYFEYSMSKDRLDNIQDIFKRLKSAIRSKDKDEVIEYIEKGVIEFNVRSEEKHKLTANGIKQNSRNVGIFKTIKDGKIETSILRCKKEQLHYEHPTQKSVELMKRLINLCTNVDDTVDPFMGDIAVSRISKAYESFERLEMAT